MPKQRKTVTLDPEVKAYLDSEGRNASETVNKLVKLEMGEDVVNEELIRMRIEMEEDRYTQAAQRARSHLERVNQLRERLDDIKTTEDRRREAIDDFIDEMLDLGAKPPADHHRVQALADKWFEGKRKEAAEAIRTQATKRDDVTREILQ